MAIIKRFSTKKKYKVIYLNEHNNKSAEFEVEGLANYYDLSRNDLDFQPTLVTVVDIETQDEVIFYVSMDFRKKLYY
jgi:hypothetical protein